MNYQRHSAVYPQRVMKSLLNSNTIQSKREKEKSQTFPRQSLRAQNLPTNISFIIPSLSHRVWLLLKKLNAYLCQTECVHVKAGLCNSTSALFTWRLEKYEQHLVKISLIQVLELPLSLALFLPLQFPKPLDLTCFWLEVEISDSRNSNLQRHLKMA